MPELVASIGADASSFIKETAKAGKSFDKFTAGIAKDTDALAKSTGRARDEFGRFLKGVGTGGKKAEDGVKGLAGSFARISAAAKKTASEVSKGFSSGGIKGAISGLKGSLGSLSAAFGPIGGIATTAFSALFSVVQAGAAAAVAAVAALSKGVLALSAALIGIGTKAAVEFGRFEDAFAQVRTLIDESKTDVSALSTGVRGLAVDFGKGLLDSTRAAYQAISAGVDAAKAVNFLEVAFKGAAAGAATVEQTTDLVTSALNAFRIPVEKAIDVSDVFFATIKGGKTTAAELAASIGQIAPVAASSGVSLAELGASLASLTANGLSTAEAATQVKALIIELQKPSKKTAGLLEEMGISADTIRKVGLQKTLALLEKGSKNLGIEFTTLFSNTRAIQGATILAGAGFESFNEKLKLTSNAAGETEKAYAKTTATLVHSFGQLKASFTDSFVELGSIIGPALKPVFGAVADFVQGVTRDFKELGTVLRNTVGKDVQDFFESFTSDASRSSSVVSSALELVGAGFSALSRLIGVIRKPLAAFAAVSVSVAQQVKILANVITAQLSAALFLLVKPINFVVKGFAAIESVTPGAGKNVRELSKELDALASTLGGAVTANLASAGETISGFSEGVSGAFDSVNGSLSQAQVGFANLSDGSRNLTAALGGLREQTNAGEAVAAVGAAAVAAAVSTTQLTKSFLGFSEATKEVNNAGRATKEGLDALSAGAAGVEGATIGAAEGVAKLGVQLREFGPSLATLPTSLALFSVELEKIQARSKLGFGELFTSIQEIDSGFASLSKRAEGARRILADKLRKEIEKLQAAFKESGDRDAYIQGIKEISNRSKELTGLTSVQVVAVQQLAGTNKDLADRVVELAGSLDSSLKPAFDAFLENLVKGGGDASLLSDALDDLVGSNKRLASSNLELGESFKGQARVADAWVTNLILVKDGLKEVAVEATKTAKTVSASSKSFSAFSQPGGIGITNRPSAGSSAFGFGRKSGGGDGRYSSQAKADLGRQLGLAPKALDQRIGRTPGGLAALIAANKQTRFASGGEVTTTGPAMVEAGEFVLNQRGLSDLGKIVAKAANGGGGGQTFNNEFRIETGGGGGGKMDMRELAFAIAPELRKMGALAAARSPVL